MPFGKMHSKNPEIIKNAKLINRTPSALAMKLTNIASLDPTITSSGRSGLTGASNADRAMWNEMKKDWNSFVIEIAQAECNYGANTDEIKSTKTAITIPVNEIEIDYTGKNKLAEINTRIGQSFFRKSVISAYNARCCISGLSVPQLLIASHIVPWSLDDKNRLNPCNGLCLSAIHDKAFDLGIITLTDNFVIKVAEGYLSETSTNDRFFSTTIIGYDGKSINLPEKFVPEPEFLHYHQNQIFKGKI
jgi:putative restriction endonuclease